MLTQDTGRFAVGAGPAVVVARRSGPIPVGFESAGTVESSALRLW